MDQIIFGNGLRLPETSRDNYACFPDNLSVQLDMISGRRVIETRGTVQKVRYAYDYMGNELMRQVLAELRSGEPFIATVLRDTGDYYTSTFLTESLDEPTMAFSRRKGDKEKDFWHRISFTLREERPQS